MGWFSKNKETDQGSESAKGKKSNRLNELLDTELLRFGDQQFRWCIRHAILGTQCFGGIGSGKSSGCGETIARSFLEAGFGGLVLCAKPEERGVWEGYCKAMGRSDDLIIMEAGGKYGINFLQYENKPTKGGDETLNLVNLIMHMYEAAQGFMAGGGGQENERFWDDSMRRLLNRTISLIKLSGRDITIDTIHEIVESIPTNPTSAKELQEVLSKKPSDSDEADKLKSVLLSSSFARYYLAAKTNRDRNARIFDLIENYFLREFPRISDRTSSVIKELLNGIIENFLMDGILRDHFSSDLEIVIPELTFQEGKIIVLDYDIKNFGLAGVLAQTTYKYLFQLAMERRNLSLEEDPSPVFLFADEAHFFLTEYDSLFATTARSALVANVYITQSINNYIDKMGSRNPEIRAKAFLANMNTRIFHNSSDIDTNKWASDSIGQAYLNLDSETFARDQSIQRTPTYRYLVEPREFTMLRTGGPGNAFEVEAYIMINTDKLVSKSGNFGMHVFHQFAKVV